VAVQNKIFVMRGILKLDRKWKTVFVQSHRNDIEIKNNCREVLVMYRAFLHKSKAQRTLWRKIAMPQVATVRHWGFAR
jgi:hypothetical protein